MHKRINVGLAIACAFIGSLAAACVVILLGMCVFGLNPGRWTEWEGRIAGVVATVAGVAGAAAGLRFALGSSGLTKV